MKGKWKILLVCLLGWALGCGFASASKGSVLISEIAWMGTAKSSADEWIELYNNTEQDIDLTGWGIYEKGGETLIEPLEGVIPAGSFYLIERTNEQTLPDVSASQKPTGWGGHGLNDKGEYLVLLNKKSEVVDAVDCRQGWFSGNKKTKQTMERRDFSKQSNDPSAWQTSAQPGGTPKEKNIKRIESIKKVKQIKPEKSKGSPLRVDPQTEQKNLSAPPASSNKNASSVDVSTPPGGVENAEGRGNEKKPALVTKEQFQAGIAPTTQPRPSQKLNQVIIVLIAVTIAVASAALALWLKTQFSKND